MPTLAQIYEDHAEDCIRAAARTDDPKQRDVLIHLAIKWREDFASIGVRTAAVAVTTLASDPNLRGPRGGLYP